MKNQRSGGSGSNGQLPREAAVLKEGSNLWQKASQLRQSLRRSGAHRKADNKVQPAGQQDGKKRSWGSQKDLQSAEPVLLPHQTPRHTRSPRKLTKDSGYETSAQGEPDYVNAEWMNDSRRSDSLSSLSTVDPAHPRPRALSRIKTEDNRTAINSNSSAWDYSAKLYRSHSYVHDSGGPRGDIYTSNESLDSHSYYPVVFEPAEARRQSSSIARYSSSDSLTSWASSSLAGGVTNARSTPTLPQAVENEPISFPPTKSTPSLDDMVTRRFKKRSVYQTLASKSGFDFAPVIQGRPYWEKTDSASSVDAQKFPVKRTVQQPFCEKQHQSPVIQYYSASVTDETPLKPSYSNGLRKAEPQQERTVSPQPPPIPIRDSSMSKPYPSPTKEVGTHEKYPSWPVTSLSPPAASTQRSHSWTESTDYPKERLTYSRPKKGYMILTHQLQPVLERSSEGRRNGSGSSNDSTCTLTSKDFAVELNSSIQKALDFDSLYDGSRHYGSEREYDVPSPPERDVPRPPQGQQMHSYLNKYNDLLYTLQQHQQESDWGSVPPPPPQHLDTPFMDRLRQDTEPVPAWASNLPEVDTGSEAGTCVESVGSSQETLKWHGSYSDISSLSFQVSNRSSLFDSGLSTMPDSGRLSPQSSCDGLFPESSRAQVVSRQGTHKENIAHSARVQPPKRHESESVLYYDNRHHRKNRHQNQPAERELCREVVSSSSQESAETRRSESFRASRMQADGLHRELKAIQKQAVLSFYHNRQSSQQDTSPPPSPQTPPETVVSFRVAPSSQLRPDGVAPSADDVSRWEELVQNLRQQHSGETQAPGQPLQGLKNATTEGSIIISAANYFRSSKSPRKAQLKEVRLSNDSVKVVTVLEKVPAADKPPQLPPKRINKPPAPPPPPNPPSRPPAPPPPPSPSQSDDDCDELRQIQQVKRSSLLTGSACSSPDLPLPPPPSNTDTEVLPSDEPLPPPPPEHLPDNESQRQVGPNHMVYPKNSYMSYRSERKLGRQGFDGNYHRPHQQETSSMSPASWEQAHCLHKHGPTVIFHSDSMPVQSVAHLPCATSRPLNRPSSSGSDSDATESGQVEQDSAVFTPASSQENADCETHVNGRLSSSASSSSSSSSSSIGDDESRAEERVQSVPRTNSATQTTDTPRLSRKEKTREELECERLSKDFVDCCGNPLLKNLLVPDPKHKTMSDYMEGLLSTPNPTSRATNASPPKGASSPTRGSPVSPNANDKREEMGLPPNSAYFTTSEPKAKLLTRYGQDMGHQEWTSEGDIDKKKEELIASIGRKLKLLRLEQVALREEMEQNETLGREVANQVRRLAKPNEMQKYCLHVEEMEKIINLLLSLSGRLARAQNALMNLPRDTCLEEKRLLEAKRDKLSAQHEEARYLKESIDRRSQQVAKFLNYYLSPEEYADYEHFVKMKSKLLMDAREVDEKIKLGEEQLSTLQNGTDVHVWHRSHSRTSSTSV